MHSRTCDVTFETVMKRCIQYDAACVQRCSYDALATKYKELRCIHRAQVEEKGALTAELESLRASVSLFVSLPLFLSFCLVSAGLLLLHSAKSSPHNILDISKSIANQM